MCTPVVLYSTTRGWDKGLGGSGPWAAPGYGLRASTAGFRVSGFGFGVWGLGFRV